MDKIIIVMVLDLDKVESLTLCNKVKRKLLLSWFIIVHFHVFVSLWSSIIEYWQYSFVGPFSRIICMSHLDIDLSHWGGRGDHEHLTTFKYNI